MMMTTERREIRNGIIICLTTSLIILTSTFSYLNYFKRIRNINQLLLLDNNPKKIKGFVTS
jgi:hypothetical protein